jgi:glycosyltransferase involved in cell wall biosynthesis
VAGGPDSSEDTWVRRLSRGVSELPNAPRFLGMIAEERDFQRLFASAAVVVMPYRYSSPASGVLVRAMSAGRPVVATPVPAAREVVRDSENGLLVPIDDAGSLARALLHLCHHPEERDRLGAAAAETARLLFSWTTHVDGLEKAYDAAGGG